MCFSPSVCVLPHCRVQGLIVYILVSGRHPFDHEDMYGAVPRGEIFFAEPAWQQVRPSPFGPRVHAHDAGTLSMHGPVALQLTAPPTALAKECPTAPHELLRIQEDIRPSKPIGRCPPSAYRLPKIRGSTQLTLFLLE